MWRSRVYWGHFEKADRKSNEFQIPAPPKKSKIRSREGEPVSPLISVQYYYFTEQRSKSRAATSAAAAAAAVRQMYTFSDSFGEKFPRGKEEKEGKVGDVS